MTQLTTQNKALLMLSALVLALHLVLLQSVPLNLQSTSLPDTSTLQISLRAAPEVVQAAVPKLKSKLKPVHKATPKVLEHANAPLPLRKPTTVLAQPEALDTVLHESTQPEPISAADAPPRATKPNLVEMPNLPDTPVAAAKVPLTESTTLDLADNTSSEDAASEVRLPNALVNTADLPTAIRLLYKVQTNKFPYTLSSELIWHPKDEHYFASLQIGAFGQYRIQTSRGEIAVNGLMPERFSDKYRSEVAAHFNWHQHKVTFSANTPDVALQEGAQDRMSILIQLAGLLATSPSQRLPGTHITMQTVGPRDADVWVFAVDGLEDLAVPIEPSDQVATIKISRKPRQLYDQQMELWMAPSLNYLPARIRLSEVNGDFVDQMWFATAAVDSP